MSLDVDAPSIPGQRGPADEPAREPATRVERPAFVRVGALVWTEEEHAATVWECQRCVCLVFSTERHETAGCRR